MEDASAHRLRLHKAAGYSYSPTPLHQRRPQWPPRPRLRLPSAKNICCTSESSVLTLYVTSSTSCHSNAYTAMRASVRSTTRSTHTNVQSTTKANSTGLLQIVSTQTTPSSRGGGTDVVEFLQAPSASPPSPCLQGKTPTSGSRLISRKSAVC